MHAHRIGVGNDEKIFSRTSSLARRNCHARAEYAKRRKVPKGSLSKARARGGGSGRRKKGKGERVRGRRIPVVNGHGPIRDRERESRGMSSFPRLSLYISRPPLSLLLACKRAEDTRNSAIKIRTFELSFWRPIPLRPLPTHILYIHTRTPVRAASVKASALGRTIGSAIIGGRST